VTPQVGNEKNYDYNEANQLSQEKPVTVFEFVSSVIYCLTNNFEILL